MTRREGQGVMFRVIALAASLAATAATSAPTCIPRHDLIVALDTRYAERQVVTSLEDRGTVIEVYVSPRGTWTMVAVTPTDLACILATGQAWQMVAVGEPS